MIKAVFFDFYNTLVRFWPPLDEIQQASCQELGLRVSKEGINRGYALADVYFNQENERRPLAVRTDAERLDFFSKYEQLILDKAGLPVSLDLARQVWQIAISVPKDFVVFDDTIPALARLHERGYRLGILSNLRRDMTALCQQLGMSTYLDFCISSTEAGAEKPHPPIFLAALQRVAVEPAEAVHVGDQHSSDVLGARAVGIHPVLIDRDGWHPKVDDCPRIASLVELDPLLAGAPESLYHRPGGSRK
ncbi:MAG: HAD family hydrolase [Dehalococcoidia bacterium]|nr:HAD family hydrolase [Dehalococcoidia bacterium]MSQ17005.1 HAD family hydrolase [Dehalococcoidia bacterium]